MPATDIGAFGRGSTIKGSKQTLESKIASLGINKQMSVAARRKGGSTGSRHAHDARFFAERFLGGTNRV
jgi:hypothetical protein